MKEYLKIIEDSSTERVFYVAVYVFQIWDVISFGHLPGGLIVRHEISMVKGQE